MKKISIAFFLTIHFLFFTSVSYALSHAKTHEKLLFGFRMAKSQKVLSIVQNIKTKKVYYRFGKPGKIEMQYPQNDSQKKLVYMSYHRGGGAVNAGLDLNYLSFQQNGFLYLVYDEYSAESKKRGVGIKVKNLKTQKSTNLLGVTESIQGNFSNIKNAKAANIFQGQGLPED